MIFRFTLFSLFLLFSGYTFAEPVEFTFAYDEQEGFPSFMGNGPEVPEEYPGTYIEMLRLVEQRVPIKLKLERYPWERCKAYIKRNRVDAINSSYRQSREELGVFPMLSDGGVDQSRRITSDTYRIYSSPNAKVYFDEKSRTIKNIGKGLAAPMGYSIVNDLKQRGVPIEQSPGGVHSIMQMLNYGRVTGVIAHQNQANYVLAQNAELSANIVPRDPPIEEKAYYILISKDFYERHPDLAEQIWDTLRELRKSHLPGIVKKYMDRI